MSSRLLRLCLICLTVFVATHFWREFYFADIKPISLVEDTETGWRLQFAVYLSAIEDVAGIVGLISLAFVLVTAIVRPRPS